MLEFYQAYANYHDLMDITEELMSFVANEVNGTTVTEFNGHTIDLGKWRRLTMVESIIEFWPEEVPTKPTNSQFYSVESLKQKLLAGYGLTQALVPEFSGSITDPKANVADPTQETRQHMHRL
jgi:lysyl-tRNA synthetase class 2